MIPGRRGLSLSESGPCRGAVRREWEPEDLIACWTLLDGNRPLVANKRGTTRLGFALMLKLFELEVCFPRHAGEIPPAAVDYVSSQVKVELAVTVSCPFRYLLDGWVRRSQV